MEDSEDLWNQVTILRKNKSQVKKNDTNLTSQMRKGNTEAVKKNTGAGGAYHKNFKLDNANEAGRHKLIPKKLSSIIMKARQVKNIKRSDLARMCCIKEDILAKYENGTAIPDNKILGNIERNLKIKLRGKNEALWGTPL